MALGTAMGILEGIVVFIAVLLIVIGISLLAADQKWLSGVITLAIGILIMGIRIYIKLRK